MKTIVTFISAVLSVAHAIEFDRYDEPLMTTMPVEPSPYGGINNELEKPTIDTHQMLAELHRQAAGVLRDCGSPPRATPDDLEFDRQILELKRIVAIQKQRRAAVIAKLQRAMPPETVKAFLLYLDKQSAWLARISARLVHLEKRNRFSPKPPCRCGPQFTIKDPGAPRCGGYYRTQPVTGGGHMGIGFEERQYGGGFVGIGHGERQVGGGLVGIGHGERQFEGGYMGIGHGERSFSSGFGGGSSSGGSLTVERGSSGSISGGISKGGSFSGSITSGGSFSGGSSSKGSFSGGSSSSGSFSGSQSNSGSLSANRSSQGSAQVGNNSQGSLSIGQSGYGSLSASGSNEGSFSRTVDSSGGLSASSNSSGGVNAYNANYGSTGLNQSISPPAYNNAQIQNPLYVPNGTTI